MSTARINRDRLAQLADRPLLNGSHETPEDGLCLMEAVAWIAGEPHTDHPKCVDPTLGNFGRALNDALSDDATRDRLLGPLVPRLVGTNMGMAVAERRSFMALDWLVRVHTVAWLGLAGLDDAAARLAALDEIVDRDTARAAGPVVRSARTEANVAGDAAGDGVWNAAWAAGEGAWDAAWAAGDVARDAAWTAGDAARDALQPTVVELQESAAALFGRMIDTTEEDA